MAVVVAALAGGVPDAGRKNRPVWVPRPAGVTGPMLAWPMSSPVTLRQDTQIKALSTWLTQPVRSQCSDWLAAMRG